jgi:hypothetical protein
VEQERIKILEMIQAGAITAEEGMALLQALDKPAPAAAPISSEPPPDLEHWRNAWLYVVYAGAGLLALGGGALYPVYASGWWVLGWCGWPLMALGLLVVVLGAWSKSARWLHVRISGRERFAISMPLPLKLTAWGVQLAQRFAPEKLQQTGLDEVIASLNDSFQEGGKPFYVDVTEDDGEHVQVYMG